MLYGLHHARGPIAKAGRAVIVEGYTDVIALHEVGVQEAVASMGTSLTEEQLTELRRLAATLVLAFDADQAGQDAALRGMRLAEQKGFEVRIVPLPAGQDPAEIAARGKEAVETALAGSVSVLAFLINRALEQREQDGVDAVYAQVRSILSSAPPTPDRARQVRRVADVLRLDKELESRLTRGARVGVPVTEDGAINRARKRLDQRTRIEREFLAACLALPADAPTALDLTADALVESVHLTLVPWVRERVAGNAAEAPAGAEDVVAELYALSARFDPAAGDVPDLEAAQAALQELMLQIQLRAADDEIGPLRVRVEDGSASVDELRRLAVLQREVESLRAELRNSSIDN